MAPNPCRTFCRTSARALSTLARPLKSDVVGARDYRDGADRPRGILAEAAEGLGKTLFLVSMKETHLADNGAARQVQVPETQEALPVQRGLSEAVQDFGRQDLGLGPWRFVEPAFVTVDGAEQLISEVLLLSMLEVQVFAKSAREPIHKASCLSVKSVAS